MKGRPVLRAFSGCGKTLVLEGYGLPHRSELQAVRKCFARNSALEAAEAFISSPHPTFLQAVQSGFRACVRTRRHSRRGTSQLIWNCGSEKARWWEPPHSCGGARLSSGAARGGLISSGFSRGVSESSLPRCKRVEESANFLGCSGVQTFAAAYFVGPGGSGLVSGHDFSRAVPTRLDEGFSP